MSKQLWLYNGLKAEIAYKEKGDDTGPIYFKKVTIKWDEKRNSDEKQGIELLQYLVDKVDNKNFVVINTTYEVLHKKGIEMGESTLKESTKFAIDHKELKDAFPLLYKEYENIYEGKRPKITGEAVTEYYFAPQLDQAETDLWYNETWVILHDNEILVFDSADRVSSVPKPTRITLQPGDAVLECHYGYARYCTMYVHPSFMNQEKLTGPTDLMETEKWIIALFRNYIPKVRYEYFSRGAGKYADSYAFSVGHNTYDSEEIGKELKAVSNQYQLKYMKDLYDFLLKGLAEKGLLKISSSGAAQLTMEGKNVALSLE